MKSVYSFKEGDPKNRRLLGGKGAGLCEMTQMRLPVPPGFTITTDVCKQYYTNNKRLPRGLLDDVRRKIREIEKGTGKRWNDAENPLLVSVRSGAAISMPGMMDTILNLGLNDSTVQGLATASGNARFAWDSYRRFVQLFGKVVFGIDDKLFDEELERAKKRESAKLDGDLSHKALVEIVSKYKKICKNHTGRDFPSDSDEQLELAIRAVFESWSGERAVVYREKNRITRDVADGTAVNVVAMVFGNMGDDSATGVVFTRNPGDGRREIFGDYLINAQGEDVVAGTRTPQPVDTMKKTMPEMFARLKETCKRLERHYREPQDIEFTIERGRFYLLQTRSAKMNAAAMIRTSVEMVSEGMITRNRALQRLHPEQLEQLLHRRIDTAASDSHEKLVSGIAASPGAANGVAIFDVKRAVAIGENGASVILVREETKPEDVPAFFSSTGILTSRGGKTSHAAVVARGMGKPCIVGCTDLKIDYSSKQATANGHVIREGDPITIDGSTGTVYQGTVPTIEPRITNDFKTILGWAGNAKRIAIRGNADTPEAAKLAHSYGAEGIGLCRTERMFNGRDRIDLFVEMIMEQDAQRRKQVLEKLGALQRSDFVEILRTMRGHPVTIRLLDPPLHEFLPNPSELAEKIRAAGSAKSEKRERIETQLRRARELAEINPMMGHRGVRVGITHPEIYEMQIRAVFEAAADLAARSIDARPQIMIPQVGSVRELDTIKKIFDSVRAEMEERHKRSFGISFGTMLEVVRACLTAGELARTAEFFSFGTNDLTQGTFSFSREDAEEKFFPAYFEGEILETSPFQSIDTDGVGYLVRIALESGRTANGRLEIGICGEHGGDPKSIGFFARTGLDYVSASPHRIPIAIVAAAQTALEAGTRQQVKMSVAGERRKSAGKKAAQTKKRRTAGKKAAVTKKRRMAGKKAAQTKKRRTAGKKAAVTRKKRASTKQAKSKKS